MRTQIKEHRLATAFVTISSDREGAALEVFPRRPHDLSAVCRVNGSAKAAVTMRALSASPPSEPVPSPDPTQAPSTAHMLAGFLRDCHYA